MAGEAERESDGLRRARDQIERGELSDAVLTLWNEGEDACAAGSRARLQQVVALGITIRDRSHDLVQASARQLVERYEGDLAAPHTLPVRASPVPAMSSLGANFVTLAVISAGLALAFSGAGDCESATRGLGVLLFPPLVAIFLSTGLAIWTRQPRGRRKLRLAGSIAAGLVAGIAIFLAALWVTLDGCLD